jgi:UDP-N-acetylglucosamine 3-dehydrogenase
MPLRIGLVGRGRWSKNLARTIGEFPEVELVFVRSGEMPAGPLDGVVVANRSASHADTALPFIEAGIPTFIEKPMTTSVADAERIGRAASRSGAIVFVGHVQLFNPALERLVELLPSIGSVHYVLYEGANDKAREDASVLWDWLPHGLSMAQAIFGVGPSKVRGWGLGGVAPVQSALAKVQFGQGTLAAFVSWQSPRPRKLLTVIGAQGTFVFDDTADRKLSLHQKGGAVDYPPYSPAAPLHQEIKAFLASINGQACVAVGVEPATIVVRTIEAVERSLQSGGQEVAVS